jgi:carbon monoxide dehydrogenase subunit G
MEFHGSVTFLTAQTAVWHTLTTPDLISQCTPRLQGWAMLATNAQFQLLFSWGSNSKVIIPLLLTWQTVTPPTYLQWQAEAQMGNTAVPMHGHFELDSTANNQTTLAFFAEITPPNKILAQMIQTTAPRLIDSFFHCLKNSAEAV